MRTRPDTVLADYARVMDLAGYRDALSRSQDTLIKLNLSWTKYFPACSSQPWQVDGVVAKMLDDGYQRDRLLPVENKTVVTDPREGCRNNRWERVLQRHGLTFTPLPEVEWQTYQFKSPLLRLNDIFPEGIQIPAMYAGRQILHLPTVKTHGHAVMTGSVKNSFGGLLRFIYIHATYPSQQDWSLSGLYLASLNDFYTFLLDMMIPPRPGYLGLAVAAAIYVALFGAREPRTVEI